MLITFFFFYYVPRLHSTAEQSSVHCILTCCSRPVPFWLIALLILSSNHLLVFSFFPFRKILQLFRFCAHLQFPKKSIVCNCFFCVALRVYTFFLIFFRQLLTFHKLLRSYVERGCNFHNQFFRSIRIKRLFVIGLLVPDRLLQATVELVLKI